MARDRCGLVRRVCVLSAKFGPRGAPRKGIQRMLFHSLQFLLFFVVVFFLNLLVLNVFKLNTARNWMLTFASLIFYMSWNVRLVGLMVFCILVNFIGGNRVFHDKIRRKWWLWASIVFDLSILVIFKYLDFGIQSAAALARAIGFNVNPGMFDLVLPLGISFYTFNSMAYVIDIYRGKFEPYESVADYILLIAFFPHLIAGPILRADYFRASLRESERPLTLGKINNGLFFFVLGFFKKTVLSDNSAHIANHVFRNSTHVSSLITALGILAFTLQIYFDFSGYTDMARGLGWMLGVNLPPNFDRPYIAAGVRDFWRRWHISLSTWLKDYLYISLGGSRVGAIKVYRNLFLTMLLGGLWHGARVTFLIWGGIHGFFLMIEHYLEMAGHSLLGTRGSPLRKFTVQVMTFLLICFTWIFFRADSLATSLNILSNLADFHGYLRFDELRIFKPQNWFFGILVPFAFLFTAENTSFADTSQFLPMKRAAAFCGLFFLILFVSGATNEFLYFQF